MKRFKLFFACMLMTILGIGQVWAEEASFAPSDFSGQGTSGSGSAISATKSTVTFASNKGYGTTQIRCYSGGKITISSANTITSISFTFSGSYTGGLSTSYTDLSTNSWEQSLSSQARITACTVTYTPAAPSHTITAVSNNTTYGTVSLSGNVITATRNPGYRYASPAYTVTSGTATVAQSGDAFTVTPSSDCTVRINFEAIPKHNIIFNNGGVKAIANAEVAEGASYDIEEAIEDALIASCTYKHFEGWTKSSSIADASVKPTLVTNIDMEDADVNLYAVYSVTSGGGSNVNEETASVTIATYATANSWSNGVQYSSVTLDENITATANGGSNTGKYYTNGYDWRFYQGESATMTLSAASGCTLKSATLNFNISNTGQLNGAGTDGAVTSGTAFTISGSSYQFSVGNSGTATNGQIKFTSISVTYDKTTSGTTTYSLDAGCAAPGQCVAPTFNHGTGTYNVAQSIELATTTDEADIYYTLDGTTPSKTNGTKYTAAFSVSENKTVKAIAVKEGNDDSDVAEAVYTFKPVTPTITKDVAHFMSAANVTIECETTGAVIHYTVDGSDPTASSPTYSAPFEITATKTVKAIAVKTNWDNSEIASETFTRATILDVAGAHTAITAGGDLTGKYVQGKISQIDSYNNTYHSITYWISDDGTTTNQLEVYGGLSGILPQFTSEADLSIGDLVVVYGTLKDYKGTHEFDKDNEIVTFTRFIAAPTFSPEGGGFLTSLNVTLACATEGAEIRYTTDGTDPIATSTLYPNAGIDLNSTKTIKAAAFKDESVSAIVSKTYTKCATKLNVTEALSALDENDLIADQFVYGVVSTAATYVSSGKMTYSISVDGNASNQLKVYNGKGRDGADFTNKDDLQVGDKVTIFGTLKIYNEEKEIDAGNYLLEFNRPEAQTYSITYVENGANEDIADVAEATNLPDQLPTVTKTNKLFGGWFTTSTFDEGTEAVAGAKLSSDVTLYAKWNDISEWAYTYTSNVTLSTSGGTSASLAKVVYNSTQYDAIKAGTSSAAGVIKVTVPAQASKLHFHSYGWNTENVGLTVTAPTGVTVSPATEISIKKNAGIANNSPFTLAEGSDPMTDAYYVISLSGNTEETTLTFSATSGKRFVLFGVNHEGGVLPELASIAIDGDLENKSYKAGDEIDMTGLSVYATYTLAGTPQTPVDITNEEGLSLTYEPLTENQTSVDITATYEGQTTSKTIEGLTVASADPKITANKTSITFDNAEQDDIVASQTVEVTLTNVAAASVALSGEGASAFSIDKTALTQSGTITVSPRTSAIGNFSATLTIRDDAAGAEDVEIALAIKVKAKRNCDRTDDFNTIAANSGYSERTSADGWHAVNTAVVVKDDVTYWLMQGNTSKVGIITSPVMNLGIGKLSLNYYYPYNETNGVSFKVDIKQGEAIVKTETITNASAQKDEVYEATIENINVAGMFQIIITNLSPSNESSSKDRFAVGDLCWTTYGEPVYTEIRTGLEVNRNYTVCLPKKIVAVKGATFWGLEHKNLADTEVYLEEATLPYGAGMPFIFLASAATLQVAYEGEAATEAGVNGALCGTLDGLTTSDLSTLQEDGKEIYMLYNNQLRPLGTNNYLDANRAYVDFNALTVDNPQSAPGRRVRSMPMAGNAATEIDNVSVSEAPSKVMIDGQLFIIRGEKLYDTTGRQVK